VALTIGIVGLLMWANRPVQRPDQEPGPGGQLTRSRTIEPKHRVVGVPDPRLDVLAKDLRFGQIVPSTVSFVDIAGIVKGASEGAGLGNKFLATSARPTRSASHRAFDDPDVVP